MLAALALAGGAVHTLSGGLPLVVPVGQGTGIDDLELVAADGAGVSGIALCRAGGLGDLAAVIAVLRSGQGFLGNQDLAAAGTAAVLTFSQAGIDAGGGNGLVDDDLMAQGCAKLLAAVAADGAGGAGGVGFGHMVGGVPIGTVGEIGQLPVSVVALIHSGALGFADLLPLGGGIERGEGHALLLAFSAGQNLQRIGTGSYAKQYGRQQADNQRCQQTANHFSFHFVSSLLENQDKPEDISRHNVFRRWNASAEDRTGISAI